ncbi:MAG: hypothetical protein MI784_07595 [Cytophagales bacterium]|nr:hypothetical protein [Cytophagales bacterium]
MRVAFVVQIEGRGHMTQALRLANILSQTDISIECVVTGKNERKVPAYFRESWNCPIYAIESPTFVKDSENREVKLFSSLCFHALRIPRYLQSCRQLHSILKRHRIDAVVNFHEFISGLYHFIYRPSHLSFAVSHSYFCEHPGFQFPKKNRINRWLFRMNNKIMSQGTDTKLALSFFETDEKLSGHSIVAPPLIFPDEPKEKNNFLLAYIVNDGYAKEIITAHQKIPEQTVHCFWDRKDCDEIISPRPNLFFHPLNRKKFLEYLRTCKGYITSAGFESVCEALYLNKPVGVVPTAGQYEQLCNAAEVEKLGIGLHLNSFDLSGFLAFIEKSSARNNEFQKWVKKAESFYQIFFTQKKQKQLYSLAKSTHV